MYCFNFSLCFGRKQSESPSASASPQNLSDATETTITSPPPPSPPPTTEDVQPEIKELPLPPAMKKLTHTYSCSNIKRQSTVRKIETSVSMKMSSVNMKMSRTLSTLKNHDQKKKGKFKSDEDSVWTKTILLGERCKPDEEGAIIYDKKGNQISTYGHKKTQSNFSLSRASSFIDQRMISSEEKDKGKNFRSLSRTKSFDH